MIQKRKWRHQYGPLRTNLVMREGWYLFGWIPIYLRDIDVRL
jgi:hypothetical protein